MYELSVLVVAGLDRDTWRIPTIVWLLVGVPLAATGAILFHWGTSSMNTAEVSGLDGDLHTSGPYSYTRNPQYVGMILGRIGLLLITNSKRVACLSILQIGWVSLLPFVEEPWLSKQFGEEYDRYRGEVPRFVGWNPFQ